MQQMLQTINHGITAQPPRTRYGARTLDRLELAIIQTSTHGLPVCPTASIDDLKLLVPQNQLCGPGLQRTTRPFWGRSGTSSMFRLLSRHWLDDQISLRS